MDLSFVLQYTNMQASALQHNFKNWKLDESIQNVIKENSEDKKTVRNEPLNKRKKKWIKQNQLKVVYWGKFKNKNS